MLLAYQRFVKFHAQQVNKRALLVNTVVQLPDINRRGNMLLQILIHDSLKKLNQNTMIDQAFRYKIDKKSE